MRWWWVLVVGLLLVAGLSVYWAFQSPTFFSGLVALAAAAAFKAVQPAIVKPLAPEVQKKLTQSRRRAEEWDFARKRPKEDHK